MIEAQEFLAVMSKTFAAGVLTWLDFSLYRASRDPHTQRGDGVLIDLGLGLVTVAAAVLWVCVPLEIFF